MASFCTLVIAKEKPDFAIILDAVYEK